ncbi:hypothetical protein AWM75_01430 [Aerococcus urinaehominis]|uniref:Uncharacterized protein n=1 Tax=Aerococcus urinaehominis TaxID=128944 RepID=A0A0X8FLC6_9LACT|nr:hypothetical protein [Aerococcus urinaehominis]AMB98737.1 hypothetical protein AWM75_01430 [Aerococcus urinaehominis]SDM63096.1 hypothetical protein SAMN04487985_1334 [Aerococcus urinaehominis]
MMKQLVTAFKAFWGQLAVKARVLTLKEWGLGLLVNGICYLIAYLLVALIVPVTYENTGILVLSIFKYAVIITGLVGLWRIIKQN